MKDVMFALFAIAFGLLSSADAKGQYGQAGAPPSPPPAPPYGGGGDAGVDAAPADLPAPTEAPFDYEATEAAMAAEATEAPAEYGGDYGETEAPAEYEEVTEAPAPAETDAPEYYEEPATATDAPEYEPTDAVEPLEEPAPAEQPESYGTPPPLPEEAGSYRRRAALKRVDWSKVRVQDASLKFDRRCSDKHVHCGYWAQMKRGDRNPETGRRFPKPLCKLNPFLESLSGCPKACNVCTNDKREWARRRRLARAKLLRLRRNKGRKLH